MRPSSSIREVARNDRRHQVALILAKGLLRWRHRTRATSSDADAETARIDANRLELCRETRLSVSDGTRRLLPRGDGDDT